MKTLAWCKNNKFLLLIIAIGAVLRFYKIDYQSLWIDEIYSMLQASPEKSFTGIYKTLRESDPHPPLYYFSLHVFLSVFGDTSLVARIFSALCGVAGIVAIFYLGKELLNKKVGLIATIIVSVNYFHIYYSQEARMYSLMFLTTTVSFLYLSKFIKNSSKRNLILYSIFSALMIYTQFFSLFTLFAQYLILLYFVIRPYNTTSKKFLIQSICAGLITFFIYIPAIPIFLKTSEMQSIWIQLPEIDVYTKMFKEFFGFAEIVLFIVSGAIIWFFIKLFNRDNTREGYIDPLKDRQIFTFIIILTWILITLLIPLASSYLKLPMIVSRYFINILPAIVLVVAAGLYYIKNDALRFLLILFFCVFSLNDVIIVKDYFSKVTKTEFREITHDMIKRTHKNTTVVVYWSWLLPYYFEDSSLIEVRGNTLDEYVTNLRTKNSPTKSFWYLDGHYRPYTLNSENQAYLDKNYRIKNKLEYLDCWANFYVPINGESSQNSSLGIEMFKPSNFDSDGNLVFFENTISNSDFITLEKGKYSLKIKAFSQPRLPINNENAHLILKINNNIIADFYLSENNNAPEKDFDFELNENQDSQFQIIYDNDILKNGKDRNAVISHIKIEKKQ